jgi:DNA-directed RNA polymerase I, II, and III subunit RPABC1
MLHKRGYIVPRDCLDMSLSAFVSKFGSRPSRPDLRILCSKPASGGVGAAGQLSVYFPEEDKVGVKAVKVYTDEMRENGIRRAVLVVRQGLTPFARQAVAEMSSEFRLECFREAELRVDVTEHELVPRHVVLEPAEKRELLRRYKLKEMQLPRIQAEDPVARFYGVEKGQVMKIIRPSETAGRYVTYRVVM